MVHLLQDEGSVHALDGRAHGHRKDMFLQTLQGPAEAELPAVFEREWSEALARWERADEVVLHEEMTELLARTAAAWCGIPASEFATRRRTRALSAMVSNAGGFGPTTWMALRLRRRAETWARDLVTRIRRGTLEVPGDTFVSVVAHHRDPDGRELDAEVAAVELLNVLRPVVAISRFVVFAGLALLRHPWWHEELAAGNEADLRGFVQEVRRLYPFFPLVGGRARRAFDWRGHRFTDGDWVLLDLYGTNHDPDVWEHPEAFLPERFRGWSGDPNLLVPQGGGEYATDHRCPGEPVTVTLMEQAVRQLTQGMRYRVAAQDLSIDLGHVPALPKDGFVIRDIRAKGA